MPVCPHAGGVGLCEAVQHFSMFDFVAITGTMEGRMIEYVDHLHEHFVTPVVIENGRYATPTAPGAGMEMLPASLDEFEWLAERQDAAEQAQASARLDAAHAEDGE
jgi:L-fuconate dehydratase